MCGGSDHDRDYEYDRTIHGAFVVAGFLDGLPLRPEPHQENTPQPIAA